MPIDFGRVPPRVPVPEPPRPSKLLWAFLLGVVMCLGAAVAIFLWPAGRPTNSAWFWFCVIGYPIFAWAFLLCCYLGYAYARRSGAIANNRIGDDEERKCHELASAPLAVLGHAWCFSSDDKENGIEGLVNGSVQMVARSSRAVRGLDVKARWLEIPEKPFYAGNELTEHARHRVVFDWLLNRLVDRITTELAALPGRTDLQVDLRIRSELDLADVRFRVQELILAKAPASRVTVNASGEHPSLFQADAWHDDLKPGEAHLLIAIQLRRAVSERLQDGVAETGVALLLGRPRIVQNTPASGTTSLRLHRPAIKSSDVVGTALELATRWGQADSTEIKTVWSHALADEVVRSIKSSLKFGEQTRWVDLGATVGTCDGAGSWLATALAAEHASLTDDPQLVLTQEGCDMIALVCRKQI
ncbi:hypothetical protein [Paraburkholderia haematera]|jgi:hypothetical protein|uniref:Uncharacterized protein n=1 Tax=Paraburkholderia haematera TaxID=2793077 RepID=A0ABN7L4S0_9BURK|nr:hypothetical protein [Paraburkholderia haematera]CAE6724415.1 hypothetical protein R69888_01767 [Paraburkholderia haematera]